MHNAISTVKPMQNSNSQKGNKLVFKIIYSVMQVKSIAECSPWSILQHFRPSLSYCLSLRSLLCLILSGRFTQVLLYQNLIFNRYHFSFFQQHVKASALMVVDVQVRVSVYVLKDIMEQDVKFVCICLFLCYIDS